MDAVIEFVRHWLGEDAAFWASYLTNQRHLNWYASFRFTIIAALAGGALALVFGLLGAAMRTSRHLPLRLVGNTYAAAVRGIPDVLFFIFFPLAFEQGAEWLLAKSVCTPEMLAAQANPWPPCQAANIFFSSDQYLALACLSLGLLFGAFCTNVIHGALLAVPRGQIEAARAFGFSEAQVLWRIRIRQMWIYALPGLSNVWMLVIKSTALLSLLQIADIVLWAERLGAPNYFARAGLVHDDWRWRYYLALFLFYILVTYLSELVFKRLTAWASRGMAVEARP